jgi:hypothetical protein
VPTFGEVDDLDDLPDLTPIEFKVVAYNSERERVEFLFHARPSLPLGVMLDLAGAASGETLLPSAVNEFLHAAITDDDLESWDAVMHDPDLSLSPKMLEEFATWLAELYGEADESNRPTKPRTAYSAGRGRTGHGSTAKLASVDSTSDESQ